MVGSLDVFEHEPAIDPRLIALAKSGKVVLMPHMGSATLEAHIEMGNTVIVNIRTWMDGHKPPDGVLPGSVQPQRRSRAQPYSHKRRRCPSVLPNDG